MTILTQKHSIAGARLVSARASAIHPRQSAVAAPVVAFFGKKKSSEKTEKELEKEEQYRVQQEVLARRKNDSWQKDVITRRAKASRYLNDPAFKKICDAENREKFLANKALEDPEPKFGIIIPLIPVGMPEYDGGERFDLRLPYVDFGWVDEEEEAEKEAKRESFKNRISSLFTFGGNKKADEKSAPGGKTKGGKIINKKKR